MMRKFLLAFFLALIFSGNAFSEYSSSGGDGSSSNPKWITSASDLASLRNAVNAGNEPSGLWYVLSNDIQLSAQFYWEPIGIAGYPFRGHFNGNNKTIYVRMIRTDEYEEIVLDKSLFGYVRTSTSSGYAVSNLNVNGHLDGYNTAGIVGHLQAGLIENCTFSGEITSESAIVDDVIYGPTAGGIVGIMGSRSVGTDDCEISDCGFTGSIKSTGDDEYFARSGGIAGVVWGGSIENCSVNQVSVIASEGEGSASGGIAGYLNTENFSDKITGCEFEGTVTSEYWAGGIAGYMHGGQLVDNQVNADASISGTYAAGGIAGYLRAGGNIESNNVNAGATVAAETYSAGGIVGVVENGTVKDNTSHAVIQGSASYQGGIVGKIMTTTTESATLQGANQFSGTSYGVGSNENGSPSNSTTSLVTVPSYTITTSSLLKTAREGEAYSVTIETNAGTTVTWNESVTGLPSGLSFSAGVISGTPTETGKFTFTISGIAGGYTLTKTFTLNVTPKMEIYYSPSPIPKASIGTSYTLTLSADPSPNARVNWTASYDVSSGFTCLYNYPDATTMQIVNTNPTKTGDYEFVITASAGSLTPASIDIIITVKPAIEISTSVLPQAKKGAYYEYTLEANAEGYTNLSWYIASGDLNGLSINSTTGKISGTPANSGSFTFTVRLEANTSTGFVFAEKEFVLTVRPSLSIITQALPSGKVSEDYSQTLSADAQSTWQIISGNLPDGLALNQSTGTISGTPAYAGNFSFTVQAVSNGMTANTSLSILIRPKLEIITPSTLPTGKISQQYSLTLSTNPSSSVWRILSGALPSGLSLNTSTGSISGIPSTAGTFTFTLQASLNGETAQQTFNITISPSISIASMSPLPDGMVSADYSYTLTTTDAAQTVNWELVSSLPSGLTLSSDTITGTPSLAGTFAFTIRLNDASGNILDVKDFRITIAANSSIAIATNTLPSGRTGESYSYTLRVNPSSANNLTWYVISGDLPHGLTLGKSTGVIYGVPTQDGTFSFTVRALSGDMTAHKSLSLTISSTILITTPSPLEPAKIYTPYSKQLEANGNSLTWSITSGTLPVGLDLNASGLIAGTPSEIGTFAFTVQAQSGDVTARKDFSLTVKPVLSIITSSDLPSVKVNSSYSCTLETDAEQTQSVSWSIISGSLPNGLTLDANTGTISGTPTEENVYTFTVQAVAGSLVASKTFTLTVNSLLEILTSSPLPSGKVGQNYSYTFAADASSVTWTVTEGTLPDGLTLSSGTLNGTPSEEGTYTFTIQAASGELTASKEFVLIIKPALSIVTASTLPSAKLGATYSFTLSTDDGNLIPLWTVTAGDFPDGLSLDKTAGTISGTPASEGTYSFTITASISGSNISASKIFILTVRPEISIITETLPPVRTDSEYYASLRTDAGEDKIVKWNIAGGSLPSGLELDSDTGIISGYSEAEGEYNFTVQAVAGNLTKTRDFVLLVGNDIMIATSAFLPSIDAGSNFSQTLALYNSTRAANWSITSGSLPAGLTLNTATGTISGVPITAGVYTFTVRAQYGYSVARKTFTLTINLAISTGTYLPNGTAGEEYLQRLEIKGTAADSVIWSADASLLPTGLNLTSDGIISGIPSRPGISNFTVYASADNAKTQKAMRIIIDSFLPVPITTTSLISGKVGREYTAELRTTLDGVMWSHVSGTLPPGLTLSSLGLISGTPIEAGIFTFTVRAATSTREGLRQLTLIIEPSDDEESEDVKPENFRSAGSGGGGCNASNSGIIILLTLIFLRREGKR